MKLYPVGSTVRYDIRFSSAMVLHGGTESVYLMALGLYRLVCLHILTKVEIWSGDTDP